MNENLEAKKTVLEKRQNKTSIDLELVEQTKTGDKIDLDGEPCRR